MTLRVTIITEIIAPYRIPVFNELACLPDFDLNVIFLAETDPSIREWHVYSNEIRFSYQVLPSWRWRRADRHFLLHRKLASALHKTDPNAIICGGYNYLAYWQALAWAKRHGKKFVLWSESNFEDRRTSRSSVEWLKTLFVRNCDGYAVPGTSSSNYLQALGASSEQIVLAPNSVDNGFFSREAVSVRLDPEQHRTRLRLPKRYVLYVGRMVKAKGTFDLLDAYAALEPPLRSDIGLVFVGDGADRSKLEHRASLVHPGRIVFSGFMHREDLPFYYALAEVFVLPTHTDPWGLVVNEAMACGLPVVVSNVAGCAHDLVSNGWNGFAVPPHSVSDLRRALECVLTDTVLKESMGARSRERIRDYSPAACASGLAKAAVLLDRNSSTSSKH